MASSSRGKWEDMVVEMNKKQATMPKESSFDKSKRERKEHEEEMKKMKPMKEDMKKDDETFTPSPTGNMRVDKTIWDATH